MHEDARDITVNEITAMFPDTIAVFNEFGVDACCGGDLTLADAATRDHVDLTELRRALTKVMAPAALGGVST